MLCLQQLNRILIYFFNFFLADPASSATGKVVADEAEGAPPIIPSFAALVRAEIALAFLFEDATTCYCLFFKKRNRKQ